MRSPIAYSEAPRSWDWMAPNQRTTSGGVAKNDCMSRWFSRRRRAISERFIASVGARVLRCRRRLARHLDVVDRRWFPIVGMAFKGQHVAGTQRHSAQRITRAGVSVRRHARQCVVGLPGANGLLIEQQTKCGNAIAVVEILHGDRVPAGRAVEVR